MDGSFTFDEIDRISTLDFINDDIQKTMLNKDRFIGLKDSIYFFQTENVIIAIHKDNQRMISLLQGIGEEYDIYGPGSAIYPYLDEITVRSDKYEESTPKGTFEVNENLIYTSWPHTENINCDLYTKKLRMDIIEDYTDTSGTNEIDKNYVLNSSADVTLTIDWNDGTSPQVISNYVGQWVEHTYTISGFHYYPKTTLEFKDRNGDSITIEDGQGTDGELIDILVQYACTNADIDLYGSTASGDWMMTNKLWVKHNFWGKHIGSYTHFWHFDNGVWSRHKADIYTNVDGHFRNNNCLGDEHKYGSKQRHLQKKVQKTKTKIFKDYDINNGDVKSHHWFVKGSLYLQLDLVLNPC